MHKAFCVKQSGTLRSIPFYPNDTNWISGLDNWISYKEIIIFQPNVYRTCSPLHLTSAKLKLDQFCNSFASNRGRYSSYRPGYFNDFNNKFHKLLPSSKPILNTDSYCDYIHKIYSVSIVWLVEMTDNDK